jgi:DNA-directed RNA polymerase subunit L
LNSEPESSRYEVEVGENRSLYFTMKGENDTLGNLLQSHIVNQITKESLITFCGYRKVHPLEETIQMVVHHNLLEEVDHSSIVTRVIFSLIESMETLQQLIESLSQKSETM